MCILPIILNAQTEELLSELKLYADSLSNDCKSYTDSKVGLVNKSTNSSYILSEETYRINNVGKQALDLTRTNGANLDYGAFGDYSTTIGWNTLALKNHAIAFGLNTIADGKAAFTTGSETEAYSDQSSAFGYQTTVEKGAWCATVFGYQTKALGQFSMAIGSNTVAASQNQFSIGKYNKGITTNLFEIGFGWNENNRKNIFEVTKSGNVGIGVNNPTEKLVVDGIIKANELIIEDPLTADFVFADDYELRPLSKVEAFINENSHLPDVPSAKQMESEGIGVAEMNQLLLQKVEELMLYVIELEKEIKELR